jgi:uncharacterized metal-binding protein
MKGWKKFNRTIWKIVRIPKIFDSDTNLTSNVAINKLLSPLYFAGILWYLRGFKRVPMFGEDSFFLGALFFALLSSFFYVWCSYFFQPDLDVRLNRPGMSTFPFGTVLLNSAISFFLIPIQFMVGKSWYYFWQPYARLCTHRGVSHWPILSVWFRVTYLLLLFTLIEILLRLFSIPVPQCLFVLQYWAKSFFPWNSGFGSLTWFVFCFPVYISDLAHESIDYLDSHRKGISYCPPQIARGLFNQIFSFLKSLINKKIA